MCGFSANHGKKTLRTAQATALFPVNDKCRSWFYAAGWKVFIIRKSFSLFVAGRIHSAALSVFIISRLHHLLKPHKFKNGDTWCSVPITMDSLESSTLMVMMKGIGPSDDFPCYCASLVVFTISLISRARACAGIFHGSSMMFTKVTNFTNSLFQYTIRPPVPSPRHDHHANISCEKAIPSSTLRGTEVETHHRLLLSLWQ